MCGSRRAPRGNPPQSWLAALPRYAELQRGEAARAGEHLRHGVPDLRLRQRRALPAREVSQFDEEHAIVLRRALRGVP